MSEEKIYRREEIPVREHSRKSSSGPTVVKAHMSQRVRKVGTLSPSRRGEHLSALTQQAEELADVTTTSTTKGAALEFFTSPYKPELFLESMNGVNMPHSRRAVYGRRVSAQDIDAALESGLVEKYEDQAIMLARKRDLSPQEAEQFVYVLNAVGLEMVNEYARRGYDLDEAEALALGGGEPPELSADDASIWDNKWEAWEDTSRAVRFDDMSFISGSYEYPIDDTEFAVLDFETTGAETRDGDRIIEVGITVVNSRGEILERVNSLINPGDALDKVETWKKVHRISREDVEDAPRFSEVWPAVADAISGCVLVAQNKKFEEEFLSSETARVIQGRTTVPSLCTVDLANRFVGDKVPNKKLGTMAEYFDVPLGGRAHEAIGDTDATSQILVGYLDHLKANGVTSLFGNVPPGEFLRGSSKARSLPRKREQ